MPGGCHSTAGTALAHAGLRGRLRGRGGRARAGAHPDAVASVSGAVRRGARTALRTGSVPRAASSGLRCLLGIRTPPGSNPRRLGTPFRRTTGLRLAVRTESLSVTDAGPGDARKRPTGQSRAGLRSKLPSSAQMSTMPRSREIPSSCSSYRLREPPQGCPSRRNRKIMRSIVMSMRSGRGALAGEPPAALQRPPEPSEDMGRVSTT